MLLGIDVGGTFTDAVIIDKNQIVAQAKTATQHEDILSSLIKVLDKVLSTVDDKKINRVSLSTTIITNAIVEGKAEQATLVVMPGPGVNIAKSFPVKPIITTGYVDHRGSVVTNPRLPSNVSELLQSNNIVISGKFSARNPANELMMATQIKKIAKKNTNIVLAHKMSGKLNFVRRTNSAYFSAITTNLYKKFAQSISSALKKRNLGAVPIHILKADGGTMPLAQGVEKTVEAIFTGPGASVLGIKALLAPENSVMSFDVGGTTTDIAFWEQGEPLMSANGAEINGYNTAVRSFLVKSIALGGDSPLRCVGKNLSIDKVRVGAAMAVGGTTPTLTDALIVSGRIQYGEYQQALQGLLSLCSEDESPMSIAEKFVTIAINKIELAINQMLHELSLKPVYTVDNILHFKQFVPTTIIGVGGSAKGLIDALGEKLKLSVFVPNNAVVANAIGAAVALPTVVLTMQLDSEKGYYIIPELSLRQEFYGNIDLAKAEQILTTQLEQQAKNLNIEFSGTEIIYAEEYDVLKDYSSRGKFIYLEMQLKTGIISGRVGGGL